MRLNRYTGTPLLMNTAARGQHGKGESKRHGWSHIKLNGATPFPLRTQKRPRSAERSHAECRQQTQQRKTCKLKGDARQLEHGIWDRFARSPHRRRRARRSWSCAGRRSQSPRPVRMESRKTLSQRPGAGRKSKQRCVKQRMQTARTAARIAARNGNQ
jgi:hypothetical protein